MRISETKLVQLVEQDPPVLVLLDQTTGYETVLTVAECDLLRIALQYFHPFIHLMYKQYKQEQHHQSSNPSPAPATDQEKG